MKMLPNSTKNLHAGQTAELVNEDHHSSSAKNRLKEYSRFAAKSTRRTGSIGDVSLSDHQISQYDDFEVCRCRSNIVRTALFSTVNRVEKFPEKGNKKDSAITPHPTSCFSCSRVSSVPRTESSRTYLLLTETDIIWTCGVAHWIFAKMERRDCRCSLLIFIF